MTEEEGEKNFFLAREINKFIDVLVQHTLLILLIHINVSCTAVTVWKWLDNL